MYLSVSYYFNYLKVKLADKYKIYSKQVDKFNIIFAQKGKQKSMTLNIICLRKKQYGIFTTIVCII